MIKVQYKLALPDIKKSQLTPHLNIIYLIPEITIGTSRKIEKKS